MDRYRMMAVALVAAPWLVIAGCVALARSALGWPLGWHHVAALACRATPELLTTLALVAPLVWGLSIAARRHDGA